MWCLGFIESCSTEGKASKAKEWTREARGVRVYLSKGIGIELPIWGVRERFSGWKLGIMTCIVVRDEPER